jgi:predicted MPP superfamily phosphohydrolase
MKDLEAGFVNFGGGWLPNREQAVCGGKINLIGLPCKRPKLIRPRAGMMNILLLHFPLWTEELDPVKYDLVLAGHSHGGQVRLPWIGPLFLPPAVGRYDYGEYVSPMGPLHVSSGIGCIGTNIRFNCPPEIVVYEV